MDTGADDYLTKPFSYVVLIARIRALLRRGHSAPAQLRVDDLVVDPAAGTCRRGDTEISLTAREFAVLECLARRPNLVISKAEILQRVWDEHYDGDVNVVEVHISSLRKKIDQPFDKRSIETVRGMGYRLGGVIRVHRVLRPRAWPASFRSAVAAGLIAGVLFTGGALWLRLSIGEMYDSANQSQMEGARTFAKSVEAAIDAGKPVPPVNREFEVVHSDGRLLASGASLRSIEQSLGRPLLPAPSKPEPGRTFTMPATIDGGGAIESISFPPQPVYVQDPGGDRRGAHVVRAPHRRRGVASPFRRRRLQRPMDGGCRGGDGRA